MPNKSSMYAVKVKIVRENGKHCVQEVYGDGWRTIGEYDMREDALIAIEQELANKDAQWSREIKMRVGWVCEECGELDKTLLESHHIKPREQFPEFMRDLDNGKCLCIYDHAFAHTGVVRDHILARYAIIIHRRLYPERFKEAREETGGEEIHQN